MQLHSLWVAVVSSGEFFFFLLTKSLANHVGRLWGKRISIVSQVWSLNKSCREVIGQRFKRMSGRDTFVGHSFASIV